MFKLVPVSTAFILWERKAPQTSICSPQPNPATNKPDSGSSPTYPPLNTNPVTSITSVTSEQSKERRSLQVMKYRRHCEVTQISRSCLTPISPTSNDMFVSHCGLSLTQHVSMTESWNLQERTKSFSSYVTFPPILTVQREMIAEKEKKIEHCQVRRSGSFWWCLPKGTSRGSNICRGLC